MAAKVIKKITARDIMGNMKQVVRESGKKDGESFPCFRCYGQAIRHTTGMSTFGEWVKLHGRFRAMNLVTGDEFSSGVAMLPDECVDPVLAALAQADVSAVDLAFDIGCKIDDGTAVGYVYEVTPLMEPSDNDPLEAMTKALPAPPKPKAAAKAPA